jgi:hypothetical protein
MTLIINLSSVAFLAGLTWYIQIVHYPLFTYIDRKSFLEYNIYHLKKSAYILFAPMLVEGVFSIMFVFDYPINLSSLVPLVCLGISTVIWLITFSKIVPLQDKLTSDGLDKEVIEDLIKQNWFRTIGWSIKLVIMIYCMAKMVFIA